MLEGTNKQPLYLSISSCTAKIISSSGASTDCPLSLRTSPLTFLRFCCLSYHSVLLLVRFIVSCFRFFKNKH